MNPKDDSEKEEKTHYIYICTKNKDWREVYAKNIEKDLISLILHEKNQNLICSDEDGEKDAGELDDKI